MTLHLLPELAGDAVRFTLKVAVSASGAANRTVTQQLVARDTVKLGELAVFDLGPIEGGRRRMGAIRFTRGE